MRREEVVHHHEVNFPTVRYFYSMQSVELRYQGIGISFDVGIVVA